MKTQARSRPLTMAVSTALLFGQQPKTATYTLPSGQKFSDTFIRS